MMNEHDAIDILKSAEQIGVDVWLDGGWGVDDVLLLCETFGIPIPTRT